MVEEPRSRHARAGISSGSCRATNPERQRQLRHGRIHAQRRSRGRRKSRYNDRFFKTIKCQNKSTVGPG